MGVDRYDVIFPFAFLASLPEYIHAGHVAAIDRSTMEFDSYLVLARNSDLADDVAFRRARQFVSRFRFASSDPDTQCLDHLVTQFSWISCRRAQASECVSDPFLLTSRSVAAQIRFFDHSPA